MELTNEVTLDGDVYCFEDAERVAEAPFPTRAR